MHLFFVYILIFDLVFSDQSSRYQNIAKLKPSSQSSLSGSLNQASLANDDSIQTCSKTGVEKNESWVLDLGQDYIISGLIINTGMSYFGPQFEIYINKFASAMLLCNYGPQLDVQRELNITCLNGPMGGRFVTIINTFSGGVRLCDVQVIVCNDGYFGSSCIFDCHCDDNGLCSKDTGICLNTCASGWMGANCQDECAQGYFGINCKNACHCENNSLCNMTYGYCPNRCAHNWLGLACQTKLPLLADQPILISSHVSVISIKWLSWNEFIDLFFTLHYQVEYKLYNFYANNTIWLKGPILVDGIDKWEQATIVNLEINSFYEFRILPIIQMEDKTEIKGGYGLKSPVFRTKCTAPEMPSITMISVYIDEMQKPGFILKWKSLTSKESNCDSIQYYKVIYKCSSEANPKIEYALQNVSNLNVSNLKFDEECWVVVVVLNNQDLESSSFKHQIITSKPPFSEPTAYHSSSISFGIFMGLFACSVLIFIILISALSLRNTNFNCNKVPEKKLKKENKIASYLLTPILYQNQTSILKSEDLVRRSFIKIKDLKGYIYVGKASDFKLFKAEFMDIPFVNTMATQIRANQDENSSKNPILNILPYDHSRVILNGVEGDSSSTYINASFIDGYRKSNAYIATQGCNKRTINDTWRLIWQVNCNRIVMLTNLIEKGETKCEQYWPHDELIDTLYGEIIVILIKVKKYADFIIRTFVIKQNDEIRIVNQFQYLSWPDSGVPIRLEPFIEFRKKIKLNSDNNILVVHCSAGVGRTGAFIAIDYLMDQAEKESQVNVYDCVKSMRENRMYMVQTLEEYMFIYDVLMEALKIGDIAMSPNAFLEYFQYLCESKEHLSLLERQYETLNEVSYKGNDLDNYSAKKKKVPTATLR